MNDAGSHIKKMLPGLMVNIATVYRSQSNQNAHSNQSSQCVLRLMNIFGSMSMVRSYSLRLRKFRVIKFLYSVVSEFKLGPEEN